MFGLQIQYNSVVSGLQDYWSCELPWSGCFETLKCLYSICISGNLNHTLNCKANHISICFVAFRTKEHSASRLGIFFFVVAKLPSVHLNTKLKKEEAIKFFGIMQKACGGKVRTKSRWIRRWHAVSTCSDWRALQ